jgi:hypothetical protein
MRSPQKRPMRSQQTEPTQLLETDPMRLPQTARARAPRPPLVELDAEGQALRERLREFRPHKGGEKNYKGLPPCDSLNRTYLGLVQRPHESF